MHRPTASSSTARTRLAVRAPLALAATAACCVAYGAGFEVRSFRLRRVEAPVLPPGQRPLRVLHISDLHVVPRQQAKLDWVRRLAALEPDLVVNTGDNLAAFDAVPAVLDALGPLLKVPGVFVMGSNDYWSPKPKNPARYLLPSHRVTPVLGERLPTEDLRTAFVDAGWTDLDNARARLQVDGRDLELVGVDDPHIGYDRYDRVSGPADPAADLTVGVAHAPYRRILDAMTHDGAGLVLAGHTHGGQLRVPFSPLALVTNCDIPRGQARGLSRWGGAWLNVSAGLGTSPYTPVRFGCPPEATLLTLVARPAGRED